MGTATNHRSQRRQTDETAEALQVDALELVSIAEVRQTVLGRLPEHWPSIDLVLSVCATLQLRDNVNRVAVMFIGPPAVGKTTPIELIADHPITYLSDDFTTASFMSHAANVPEDLLPKRDLLRRIRHKVFLTPEMAPIFRGKEDELTNRFNRLTRVLDGHGFTSDSATHGRRGDRGDYLFAWIGATTPFPPRTWELMNNLGSRLFFYAVTGPPDLTPERLAEEDLKEPIRERLDACQKRLHQFLSQMFPQASEGKVPSVPRDRANDPEPVRLWIGRLAVLLVKARSQPTSEGESESPRRVHAVFYNLACGQALVHGRTQLTADDLPLLAHVALSSIPPHISKLLRVLITHQELNISEAAEKMGTHRTQWAGQRSNSQSGAFWKFSLCGTTPRSSASALVGSGVPQRSCGLCSCLTGASRPTVNHHPRPSRETRHAGLERGMCRSLETRLWMPRVMW
jgi:hypothetical protein